MQFPPAEESLGVCYISPTDRRIGREHSHRVYRNPGLGSPVERETFLDISSNNLFIVDESGWSGLESADSGFDEI